MATSIPTDIPTSGARDRHVHRAVVTRLPRNRFARDLITRLVRGIVGRGRSLRRNTVRPDFGSIANGNNVGIVSNDDIGFNHFSNTRPRYINLASLIAKSSNDDVTTNFVR